MPLKINMNRQDTDRKIIFANHITIRELVSNYIKKICTNYIVNKVLVPN